LGECPRFAALRAPICILTKVKRRQQDIVETSMLFCPLLEAPLQGQGTELYYDSCLEAFLSLEALSYTKKRLKLYFTTAFFWIRTY
jgi:hypothetical protein